MTAEEIRKMETDACAGDYQMGAIVALVPIIRELTAQVADLVELLRQKSKTQEKL